MSDLDPCQEPSVTVRLRELILNGAFAAGDHIREARVAEMLGVSRTPVRLALGALEHEGLVSRLPNRGFRVRGFSVQDICQAIDVRGVLEGMAARLVAEAGPSPATCDELYACLEIGDALLAKGSVESSEAEQYEAMNVRFHDALIDGSGNRALKEALAHIETVPFSGAGAVAFHDAAMMYPQFALGHSQHHLIVEAIEGREGARAEALMREHALIAKRSLDLLNLIDRETEMARIPGLRLVEG